MSDVRTDMRADGHMNLTWYCPYCERRNRTHVRLDDDVKTVLCEHCTAEADIFPTQVVVYSVPLLGETEDDAA